MSQVITLLGGGGSGGAVLTLTGNSGGAVGPDGGGNINVLGGTNTTVVGTPGTNTLTINVNTTSQTVNYTPVTHATPSYTVLATDYYLGVDVTGGAISILLPNAPATGRIFAVKDVAGLAGGTNITVTTVGGVVNIDGATTFVMNTAYESVQLIFNGTSYEVY